MPTEKGESYKTGNNSDYQQQKSSTAEEITEITILTPPELLDLHMPENLESFNNRFHQFAF